MAAESTQHLSLTGEMTIFNAVAQREQLMAALDQAGELEVDLSQVTEMDSAGLQLMLAAQREAEARNAALRFVRHSPAALAVIDLTDLSSLLGASPINSDA